MKSLKNQTSAPAEAGSTMRVLKPFNPSRPTQQYTTHISRIAIPTADGLRMISLSDILYVKADSNYSIIHTIAGKRHLVSKSLKQFANRLKPLAFVRTHQSYLVNTTHIESINSADGHMVILCNGAELPMSRRQAPEVKSYLINQFSI